LKSGRLMEGGRLIGGRLIEVGLYKEKRTFYCFASCEVTLITRDATKSVNTSILIDNLKIAKELFVKKPVSRKLKFPLIKGSTIHTQTYVNSRRGRTLHLRAMLK